MTTTLTEFLLARIAEDEGRANRSAQLGSGGAELMRLGEPDSPPVLIVHPARVLAECEAKRRIVATAEYLRPGAFWACEEILRHLALPYADHADYDPAWSPADSS